VWGTNNSSGYGVYGVANGSTGQGVWGESFGTGFSNGAGSDGVHGVSHSSAGSGAAGVNDAKDATGVYGSDPQGYGFVTDSHVSQWRGSGGWVKAMVYFNYNYDGTFSISRCFNSQIAGSAASTPPCGITASGSNFNWAVNFGFEVDDRFVQVSFLSVGVDYGDESYWFSGNQVNVYQTSQFVSNFFVFVF
jgi:hypothetical protein